MNTKFVEEKIKQIELINKQIENIHEQMQKDSKQSKNSSISESEYIDKLSKNLDKHFHLLDEYAKAKRELVSLKVDNSVLEIADPKLKDLVQKFLSKEKVFPAEKNLNKLSRIVKERINFDELIDEEVDALSLRCITSWISTYDIV